MFRSRLKKIEACVMYECWPAGWCPACRKVSFCRTDTDTEILLSMNNIEICLTTAQRIPER